ncbi:MAG: chaperone NapD [Planctomycetales bacterium]|nr:chaperone NapD [Planctomycetales bacterium]MBN8624727.1 chaperone NapD [Planctomycetota bacterium]
MIAGVVATLNATDRSVGQVLKEIAGLPHVEVGEVADPRRIPLTVEAPLPRSLEETTNAIQRCDGVAFVDVVFVHFEGEPAEHPASAPQGTDSQ